MEEHVICQLKFREVRWLAQYLITKSAYDISGHPRYMTKTTPFCIKQCWLILFLYVTRHENNVITKELTFHNTFYVNFFHPCCLGSQEKNNLEYIPRR